MLRPETGAGTADLGEGLDTFFRPGSATPTATPLVSPTSDDRWLKLFSHVISLHYYFNLKILCLAVILFLLREARIILLIYLSINQQLAVARKHPKRHINLAEGMYDLNLFNLLICFLILHMI